MPWFEAATVSSRELPFTFRISAPPWTDQMRIVKQLMLERIPDLSIFLDERGRACQPHAPLCSTFSSTQLAPPLGSKAAKAAWRLKLTGAEGRASESFVGRSMISNSAGVRSTS